ncbi:hypothetical protein EMCRGX_G034192 [Ephydatia muelleri]
MSDSELTKSVKELKKIIDSDTPNTEMALDVLTSLQHLQVTVEGLHKSRACTVVRKVLKKCRGGKKRLTIAATKLLKSWKKLDSTSTKLEKDVGNAKQKEKRETVPSPSSSSVPSSESSRIEQPIYCIDSIVREKSTSLLSNVLSRGQSNVDKNRMNSLAALIEEYIFAEFNDTGNKYKMRVRSRVANLGDLKNPELKRRVLSGEISPSRIATMTAEEMASDMVKKLRAELTKDAIRDAQAPERVSTSTDLLSCPVCKKRKCSYTQAQTLSGDEPMTTFAYCNECGHRWRFY